MILNIRNISQVTYSYYKSLSMQFMNLGRQKLAEQPAKVVGNIEGGYGIFSVYNTTSISLLEWETYEYREK